MAREIAASAIGDRCKRRRTPQQTDLFRRAGAETGDGGPAWPDLPEDARNALVGFISPLRNSVSAERVWRDSDSERGGLIACCDEHEDDQCAIGLRDREKPGGSPHAELPGRSRPG